MADHDFASVWHKLMFIFVFKRTITKVFAYNGYGVYQADPLKGNIDLSSFWSIWLWRVFCLCIVY